MSITCKNRQKYVTLCRPEGPEGVKKSVVASNSSRLINRPPIQAAMPTHLPQDHQQDQPGSADEDESGTEEKEEEQSPVREKTPDTNVKLNQPLRCGRYGQDLVSHKQRASDRAASQIPRFGAGGKVDPALIASRQSTSAAPVVPKAAQAKVPNPKALRGGSQVLPPAVLQPSSSGQSDRAFSNGPAQADAPALVGGAAAKGPAPAGVDELLSGPVPRGNIMTASMATAANAMADTAAAMAAGTAADREAVKAALGHHYRQYRAKKAAAEERAKAAELAHQSGPDFKVPVSQERDAAVRSHQRPSTQHQIGEGTGRACEAAERHDVPLRVQYGSGSSGSSSLATSTRSQDTATTSCSSEQLPQQHAKPEERLHVMQHQADRSALCAKQHQAPSRINYRRSSTVQHHQKARPLHAQQVRQLQQQLVTGAEVQLAAPEDIELRLPDDANRQEEDVRRSNDKLDMLLQSTVKRTQQAVAGKENKVRAAQFTLHFQTAQISTLSVLMFELGGIHAKGDVKQRSELHECLYHLHAA